MTFETIKTFKTTKNFKRNLSNFIENHFFVLSFRNRLLFNNLKSNLIIFILHILLNNEIYKNKSKIWCFFLSNWKPCLPTFCWIFIENYWQFTLANNFDFLNFKDYFSIFYSNDIEFIYLLCSDFNVIRIRIRKAIKI